MIKKIICLFIILLSLIQVVIPATVHAKTTNYLALGDSIAYGYGLDDIDNKSYAQLVRKELEISDANYKNLAISGITCKKFYNIIKKNVYSNEIKNADLITISIGSNELLQIAVGAIAEITDVDANDIDFFNKVQQTFFQASINKRYDMATKIYEYFSSDEAKEKINDKIKTYDEYWDKSIVYIKKLNPDATIIVTEFYNPYAGIKIGEYELGNFADEAIRQMNEILTLKSNNEQNYKVAKIYEEFNNTFPKLTNAKANVSITNFELNVDPHPNSEGHELIASKILDTISISSSNNNISIEPTAVRQAQNTVTNEKESIFLKMIFWITIGALMYFIIKKLNKNEKNRE